MNQSFLAHRSRRPSSSARPHLHVSLAAALLLTSFALVGCADPAANAPDAVVSEPAETTAPAPAAVDLVDYTIDASASKIGFVGAKITDTHEGGFHGFSGTIQANAAELTAGRVAVTIDTTSVWSDNDNLTGHLMSEDFFSVEEFPTASFESTEIIATDTGYEIVGNLDLHGITKQIRFPATIEVTDAAVTANAEFSIKRFDFGIEYPGRADDLIHDDVLIKLDLTANAT